MKNIQIIDGAVNCVYDIFAATEEEFNIIFPSGQDIAFIEEIIAREPQNQIDQAFRSLWTRRIPKSEALGIHGVLFYELEEKKIYYPTRKDEEAQNPGGYKLRA